MYNEKSFICYYPIFTIPPTIFHYNTAQLLSKKHGVSGVIVLIPKINTDYLNQDQAVKLFELYMVGSPVMDVKIEKAEHENPLMDIKAKFSKEPDLSSFLALDEKIARSPEFNRSFSANNNLELQLVPSNFEKSSAKMKQALETGNRVEFLKYVPAHLTDIQKNDCWNSVHSEIQEQIVTRQYWDNLFSDF